MTEGLRLTFTDTPHLSLFPPPWAYPKKKDLPGLHSLLPSFLERGVIREIFSPVPLFFSRVFIVPKKDGPLRMVIDLHILNRLLVVPHFLMESVLKIAEGIIERLWGCTIDLKDAYFHVPMAWFFHQFLAFAVEGRTYVFQYLPFGLSLAPWAFHRVIKPVMAQLHREFIRIHSYLDDFLNLHPLREDLLQSTERVLNIFTSLGILVNIKKSAITPSQTVVYLGVLMDLQSLTLQVPPQSVQKVLSICREAIEAGYLTRC